MMKSVVVQPHNTSELATQTEAARITGYSQYWLQKKRVNGGGPPYIKKGYFVYYLRSGLAKFKKPKRRTKRAVRSNKVA
ncbi:DNA-binding protein [Endozoicomonas sp. SM1973]|uniref:DNA-binding protein n=1 Tax=Spartinivicinus marinus TaxID=2994442 RepID=A0A853IHF6_9GAMM|nr:DNA-binding protein [Spartinivicinus marinus]NYZ69471.1 DNA-binding protein [Spartinivicinus marinus]